MKVPKYMSDRQAKNFKFIFEMRFLTPWFTDTSIKCENTNQLNVPDTKMYKITSPEPHRKGISILFFQPA